MFRQKLWDAGYEKKTKESYSPWQNAANWEIKELKKTLPEDFGVTAWSMRPM